MFGLTIVEVLIAAIGILIAVIVFCVLAGLYFGAEKVREWRSDCNCIQCREMRINESRGV